MLNEDREKFKQILFDASNKLGIDINEDIEDKLYKYFVFLIETNKNLNLTAITEVEEVIYKHFMDSLLILKSKYYKKDNKYILDIGTGAGFPGIPLSILCPENKFLLLDSLNKRIKFLNDVKQILNLSNIETIHGRAEDIAFNDKYREKFDYVVSRAVARLSILSEYSVPFVKEEGYFCAYKTNDIEDEINGAKKCISILGAKIDKVEDINLNYDNIVRKLIFIKKINKTSKKFPRKAGLINKKPIE